MKRSPTLEIVCAGIGGRGVLFASTILLACATRKGIYAIGSDEYGMSQRGGSVVSFVKVGNVNSPLVGRGRADVILAFEESELLRNLIYLKKGGVAIVNTKKERMEEFIFSILQKRDANIYSLDADKIAREEKLYQASNVALLGFFSSLGVEPFTYENMKESISEKVQGKMAEINLRIFEKGYKEGMVIFYA